MDELDKVILTFNLTIPRKSPLEIPDVGRLQLAELFHTLGYKVGAEIGVQYGAYSEIICKSNLGVKLYCVDIWQDYPGYIIYKDPNEYDVSYNKAKEKLKNYDVKFTRKFSMDALEDFEDGSLDFVYIDANHEFTYVVNDVYYWSRKVRLGGIVSGHDYVRRKREGNDVVDAINGYTYAYKIHPWFLLGTKAVIPGQIHERSRSWFWIKK